MPDVELLGAQNGVKIKHIEQTYLLCESGKNTRVRKICEGGKVSFIKTVKQRISVLSSFEEENEITESEYAHELTCADPDKKTIVKTRYCIPFGKHTVEIDLYPFWSDRAILEVELASEDEEFSIPSYIRVIKEVSDDARYKNTKLAKSVPMDEI